MCVCVFIYIYMFVCMCVCMRVCNACLLTVRVHEVYTDIK